MEFSTDSSLTFHDVPCSPGLLDLRSQRDNMQPETLFISPQSQMVFSGNYHLDSPLSLEHCSCMCTLSWESGKSVAMQRACCVSSGHRDPKQQSFIQLCSNRRHTAWSLVSSRSPCFKERKRQWLQRVLAIQFSVGQSVLCEAHDNPYHYLSEVRKTPSKNHFAP